GGLVAGEGEIGAAELLEGGECIGRTVVPRLVERLCEALEAALRHVDHEGVAIAKMPVGRRRADARRTRGFREGEAGRPVPLDQIERRPDQRLLEVAVMIPALAAPIVA